ncbi:MAG: acetate--CoA ligase family protein [Candidatus Methanoplasma sp.]|jgi:acetyltransferase|nr:acetate--CoA ligase family protein [Candidatus Methanoplasma sp.]
MKSFLSPKSVAIIGASADVTKLGGMLLKNMIDAGFKGGLYPVNPKGGEIQGVKAYASVTEIGKPVDLAVVAVKNTLVIEGMDRLGKAGVKCASILTAGFREESAEGAELEKKLLEAAKKNGVRILGPNCFGNMNIKDGVNVTFTHIVPPIGNIAILSQSGALGSSILEWAKSTKLGNSKFVTFGNKSDVDEGDLIPYLSEDPDTKVIGMYCEGISNGAKLVKAVENMAVKKPIVVFKSGKTAAGSAAASSHTGSLAGSDTVNDVVFNKLNMHRASDADELFDALAVFSTCSLMKKDGIAIITNAGGLGVMSADAAYEAPFIHAAKLAQSTIDEIKNALPNVAGLTNPIDIRGDAKAEHFRSAIKAVIKDPSVGGLVVMGSPLDTADLEAIARIIVEMRDEIPIPTTCCFAGGEKCDRANAILRDGKIPCYPTPDRAVRALSILRKYTVNKDAKHDPLTVPKVVGGGRGASKKVIDKARAEGRKSLTEAEGKQIFAAYGISVPGEATVRSADDAAKECDRIGYPVVMKILSPDIAHKTDVGGVVVGVKSREAAKEAFAKIMSSCKAAKPDARLDGVSIQQMAFGQEVILSMIRDVQFGPVVSFGLGGIYVEILGEISQAHVPMSEQQLDRMITSTKAYKLLSGARGLPLADVDAVKDMIRRIVLASVENPEILELEINPVIVGKKGEGCWAVDALCTLSD